MDSREVGAICREQIGRSLENIRSQKVCPKCKKEATMFKIYVGDPEGDEFSESSIQWRCMACLELFEEKLVPSTEESESPVP